MGYKRLSDAMSISQKKLIFIVFWNFVTLKVYRDINDKTVAESLECVRQHLLKFEYIETYSGIQQHDDVYELAVAELPEDVEEPKRRHWQTYMIAFENVEGGVACLQKSL